MCVTRYLWFLLGIIYSLGTSVPTAAQVSLQKQFHPPPAVQADLLGDPLWLDQTGSATFRIAVRIPPDHHGYLDRGDEGLLIPFTFTFTPFEQHGIRVILLSPPPGKRDDKVHATVLRGGGKFTFRLEAQQATFPIDRVLSAMLRYQICNDVTNVCYAPRTLDIPVRLADSRRVVAPSASIFPTGPSATTSSTLGERITALFHQYKQHLFLAFGLVFIAGLLASATPCVYPVLPITSAILMARGGDSRQSGRLHAMSYFLGIIFFYILLGFFAAVMGTALSAIMANAWVNLGFAAVFTYFGLSMLGLYEFQFVPALVAKLDVASGRRQGVFGTFCMGTTVGLVVSPCVGPIAGAILLGITGQAAGASSASDVATTGVIFRGIALMTSFGAGLGLPFLVVGLVSHWLPQSGTWLTRIKFILGVPILYFAYTYYLKSMETAGISDNVAQAMLLGAVAIGLGVIIGAFYRLAHKPSRGLVLRRALGIILLIIGVHFLSHGLEQSDILLRTSIRMPSGPLAMNDTALPSTLSKGNTPSGVEMQGNLRWLRDFTLAQQRARSEHKPLFVDFYATWCANCKAFQQLAAHNAELNHALQQAILVKIYDTDAVFRTFQQDPRYPELRGVGGQPFLPLFAIYSSQGTLSWKGQNYQAVQTMMFQLEHANSVN